MPTSLHGSSSLRGFTLLELVLVLGILGFMSGLVLAFWQPSSSQDERLSKLQSYIESSRQLALRNGEPYRLELQNEAPQAAVYRLYYSESEKNDDGSTAPPYSLTPILQHEGQLEPPKPISTLIIESENSASLFFPPAE